MVRRDDEHAGSEARRAARVGRRLRILETRSNLMRSGLTFRDHRDAIIEKNRNEELGQEIRQVSSKYCLCIYQVTSKRT